MNLDKIHAKTGVLLEEQGDDYYTAEHDDHDFVCRVLGPAGDWTVDAYVGQEGEAIMLCPGGPRTLKDVAEWIAGNAAWIAEEVKSTEETGITSCLLV